jgi:hypothetical protein
MDEGRFWHDIHLCYPYLQGVRAADFSGSITGFFSPSQPEPVLFPRKTLDQVFAVLLMRSAYEAVDDLNFIPMVSCCEVFAYCLTDMMSSWQCARSCLQAAVEDQYSHLGFSASNSTPIWYHNLQDKFQIAFWKLRQSEYEPYLLQRSPLWTKQVVAIALAIASANLMLESLSDEPFLRAITSTHMSCDLTERSQWCRCCCMREALLTITNFLVCSMCLMATIFACRATSQIPAILTSSAMCKWPQ